MDRCKISKWVVVLGAPERVNIPYLIYQFDVKMTMNSLHLNLG